MEYHIVTLIARTQMLLGLLPFIKVRFQGMFLVYLHTSFLNFCCSTGHSGLILCIFLAYLVPSCTALSLVESTLRVRHGPNKDKGHNWLSETKLFSDEYTQMITKVLVLVPYYHSNKLLPT